MDFVNTWSVQDCVNVPRKSLRYSSATRSRAVRALTDFIDLIKVGEGHERGPRYRDQPEGLEFLGLKKMRAYFIPPVFDPVDR